MNSVVLHQAPWVIPVSNPVIKNGAIAVEKERIVAVGSLTELVSKFQNAPIKTYDQSALSPALINAHIHLELSHIPIPSFKKDVSGFTDWIETLLSMREEKGDMGEDAELAAHEILMSQHQQGVIALGDIGNTVIGDKLRNQFPGVLVHFNECLGRSAKTRRAILDRVNAASPDRIFTAHAPYSTHPELIRELKKRAARYNHPFPIHVAEPPSENELLCCGTGELHTFLRRRGFIDDLYKPPASDDTQGSVKYLHDLGVLDKRTICVHCIHVTPEEVEILAENRAKVCLCPGSNRYLKAGKAPVTLFLEKNLLPALGTDSMASNPELSLWREMKILQEDNPEVDPADIFTMATLGGAKTLCIDDEYGSLEQGKSAKFISVPIADDIANETMLYAYLIQQQSHQPSWVS